MNDQPGNEQPGANGPIKDAAAISRSMAEIAETSQRLVAEFLARQGKEISREISGE